MGLRLYNTLTRTKEDFRPIDPENVRMYVCGPTVYDFAHIGNARPLIVFDVLFRLLRHLYGSEHVAYVRNITDVDDKINARAAEEYPDLPLNEAIRKVTTETERQFHEDVAALGCLRPTVEPRATEHIDEMKAMIERLIANGCAYVAEDHVLFHTAAMKDYGRLSNRSLDEMIAGARVEVAPYKKNPTDFVLWKPSKPGEPAWPSPAGIATPGRPGWHLECSAMSDKWLWQDAEAGLSEAGRAHPHRFDIHGGGIDLVFPHHENEIAQSRCAFTTPAMANTWLHNGFLQVEGEKMSKSLGNFVTIRELLETDKFGGRSWPGQVLRFAMLKTHYREPIDWTQRGLAEAYEELRSWANALSRSAAMHEVLGGRVSGETIRPPAAIVDALLDDLNTASAVTIIREYGTRLRHGDQLAGTDLLRSCEWFGFLRADKLDTYNQFHVRSGRRVVPRQLHDDLEEIQVAIANNQVSREQALVSEMLAKGVKVTPLDTGGISYEVLNAEDAVDTSTIEELVSARNAARKAKNYAEADRIRDELDAMGIALKDSKDPETGELVTTWDVKR